MLNLSAIAHGSSSCESQPCNYVLKLCWNLLESMLSKKKRSHSRNFHVPSSTNKYSYVHTCRLWQLSKLRHIQGHVTSCPNCGSASVSWTVWCQYQYISILFSHVIHMICVPCPQSHQASTAQLWGAGFLPVVAHQTWPRLAVQQILKPERSWIQYPWPVDDYKM